MKTNEEVKAEIPYGYCHCGCGEKTTQYKQSDPRTGAIKGDFRKWANGHSQKGLKKKETSKFCKRGHKRTAENTTIDKLGYPTCKLCKTIWFENNRRKTKIGWCKKGLHETPYGGKCKECEKVRRKGRKRKPELVQASRVRRIDKIRKYELKIRESGAEANYRIASRMKISINEIPNYVLSLTTEMLQAKRQLKELN